MKLDLEDGKYTILSDDGRMQALRYGEQWRDLTGDNLVGALVSRIEELEYKLAAPQAQPEQAPVTKQWCQDHPASAAYIINTLAARLDAQPEQAAQAQAGRIAAWLYQHKHDPNRAACVVKRLDTTLDGFEEYWEIPLYAAPSQPEAGRVGLTEAQIAAVAFEAIGYDGTGFQDVHSGDLRWFARCIERAHGIPAAKTEGER